MHAMLKGHVSLSFQKSLLNDTTWGSQVVIAIETSNAHRYRNFEWPQENWGKGERSKTEYNYFIHLKARTVKSTTVHPAWQHRTTSEGTYVGQCGLAKNKATVTTQRNCSQRTVTKQFLS